MLPGLLLLLACNAAPSLQDAAAPAPGPLKTRWTDSVRPDSVWPEYPRPQLRREAWQNLNGLWDYAITPEDAPLPTRWDGRILVPFPVESTLSGVTRAVGPDQALWYRRSFTVPAAWAGKHVLLHFGAVDWDATVTLNGARVGTHRGGYDPFEFDITPALHAGDNELLLRVWDPSDAGTQPRGKQVRKPEGIWYTSTTGIWQTVWIEPVDAAHIGGLHISTDPATGTVTAEVRVQKQPGKLRLETATGDGATALQVREESSADSAGPEVFHPSLRLTDPHPWSPEDPYLYTLSLKLYRDGTLVDEVHSYFGLRTVRLDRDAAGITRIFLNGAPVFQIGPLDQGFWPDGLYTPPCEEAMRYDLEVLKELGFNMLRKHVKVECDRYYYWCDRMGLLVWQDMPSGDASIGGDDPDITRTEESAREYEQEWAAIIAALRNHPSIVQWVPFNEGWGQFDTERIVAFTKQLDPTRLVDNASGWTDRNTGDVVDWHVYPGPGMPPVEERRAAVLGEFGGLGLPLAGHTWLAQGNWGYRSYPDQIALSDAYVQLMTRLRPLIGRGLCAAVYTQTTDVEIEVNGLMSYDRAVLKVDAERARTAHRKLFLPPPSMQMLVPASETTPQTWKFAFAAPGAGWERPGTAAGPAPTAWKEGPAGFGTEGTPGALVRTTWNTPEIWMRRDFELAQVPSDLQLWIHHDEDAEVFLNGVLAAKLAGYTTGYEAAPISAEALAALHTGTNTLAIHCRQTGGGQYIDCGLVRIVEQGQ